MKELLRPLTDRVSTRKGTWIVILAWLLAAVLLSVLAPSSRDYSVSSIQSLPDDSPAMEAAEKASHYFPDDEGTPAILVFNTENGELELTALSQAVEHVQQTAVDGVKEIVPFHKLPPPAQEQFLSEDRSAAAIPFIFEEGLETDEIEAGINEVNKIASEQAENTGIYVTGPAGIAVDTTALFSQADIVLLLSTVGIILALLIIIYRSPLLALIPLLASAVVYAVTDRILGLYGKAGLDMSSQSLSIMTILLFAAVTDYSLFVLARYREELKVYDDKYKAMKEVMRGTGEPLFFSGGTVLAAMLVLFFASIGDYQNFAPIFATVMAVIMIGSLTLVPALFILFGRRSFWPKVPQVGGKAEQESGLWSKVGSFVTSRPLIAGGMVLLLMIVTSLNTLNIKYEFNTLKSFPDDMPSLQGYEVVEEKFAAGDVAPTTVIFEGNGEAERLAAELEQQPGVGTVTPSAVSEEGEAQELSLSFEGNPYEEPAMKALEALRENKEAIVKAAGVEGELYFAGETAQNVDDRLLNNRDLKVIVLLETILIFVMLIVLTRSVKMPIYMVGTILVSFLSALGLGIFLTELFFGIDAISTRVPLYAFIFLVALGIDYNIILVSRYLEEREKYPLKEAVKIAVSKTGGVISSAGIILAATFAVLMTQPIEILFVFGFIVAIGILIDTFLVRGLLLPSLLIFFEKNRASERKQAR